jgi:CRISPR-associated protein Cas2
MSRQLFLVCYDIACPRRAYRVRKALRSFAFSVQKSIVECSLSIAERDHLMASMTKLIDPDQDRFLLMHIDPLAFPWQLGKTTASARDELVYWG